MIAHKTPPINCNLIGLRVSKGPSDIALPHLEINKDSLLLISLIDLQSQILSLELLRIHISKLIQPHEVGDIGLFVMHVDFLDVLNIDRLMVD